MTRRCRQSLLRRRIIGRGYAYACALLSAAHLPWTWAAADRGEIFDAREEETAARLTDTMATARAGGRSLQTGGGVFGEGAAESSPVHAGAVSLAEKKRLRREGRLKRKKAERAAARKKANAANRAQQRRKAPRVGERPGADGRVETNGGDDEDIQTFVDSLEVDIYPLCGDPSSPNVLTSRQKSDLEADLKEFFDVNAQCDTDGPGEIVTESVHILDFEAGDYCFHRGSRGLQGAAADATSSESGERALQKGLRPFGGGPKRSALRVTRRFRCRRCGRRPGVDNKHGETGGRRRKNNKKQQAQAVHSNREMLVIQPPFFAEGGAVKGDAALEVSLQAGGRRQNQRELLQCPVNLIDVLRLGSFPAVTFAAWSVSVVTVMDCSPGTDTCTDAYSGCCETAPSWCACPGDAVSAQEKQLSLGALDGKTLPSSQCIHAPYAYEKKSKSGSADKGVFKLSTEIEFEGFCGDHEGNLPAHKAENLQSFLEGYFNALLTQGGCSAEGIKFDKVEITGFHEAGWCSGREPSEGVSVFDIHSTGTCDGDICIDMHPEEVQYGQAASKRKLLEEGFWASMQHSYDTA